MPVGSDNESEGESLVDCQVLHLINNSPPEAQESGESSSDGELENLTAKQINAEVSGQMNLTNEDTNHAGQRPVPVQNRKPGNIANTRDAAIENASNARKVGRRAKKVLDEVSVGHP